MSNLDYHMVYVIITCYILIAFFWMVMAFSHVKWGTKNSFAGIGYMLTFLYYGYRNYDYVFISMLNQSGRVLYQNMIGVIAFTIFTYFMSQEYLIRWIKKLKK